MEWQDLNRKLVVAPRFDKNDLAVSEGEYPLARYAPTEGQPAPEMRPGGNARVRRSLDEVAEYLAGCQAGLDSSPNGWCQFFYQVEPTRETRGTSRKCGLS